MLTFNHEGINKMNLTKSVKISAAMSETSERDLAESLGITRTWLWKLLKENNPKHIEKMADFYGISVSEFIKRGE